jgi:hypothetical protein
MLRADPVGVSPYDRSEMPFAWIALFLEVLVVTYGIRSCRLRPVRFIPVWFAVNLLTFYELLPLSVRVFHSLTRFDHGAGPYYAGELVVFVVEAALLIVVSRWSYVRKPESKTVSIPTAMAASFAGNFTSIFAYAVLSSFG